MVSKSKKLVWSLVAVAVLVMAIWGVVSAFSVSESAKFASVLKTVKTMEAGLIPGDENHVIFWETACRPDSFDREAFLQEAESEGFSRERIEALCLSQHINPR